jgi:phosphatidylserine/phosphatidylglycerophosphate/cardiolipin synthase-like enzyme
MPATSRVSRVPTGTHPGAARWLSGLRASSLALLAILTAADGHAGTAATQAEVAVCFTPPEDCGSRLQQEIDAARSTIRVLAYELTADNIVTALTKAKQRGVDVKAVLDPINERGYRGKRGSAAKLTAVGIPVWIDDAPGLEHNKTIVIDDNLVIGGSYNYTYSAQTWNAENMTTTRSPVVAGWFLDNWMARMRVSRPYSPAGE